MTLKMNLSDPELELVDPTPNVHSLFLHFDQVFFWTKLASRAVVRWSKRMYSCAGICSYDRGGLCDIALSEPLLKLRPRKDLVETLLHEMIHAYLFVTCRDQDRDGHGPNFKEHMHRINKAAGLNISIYHDFHDEVELYKTHWWRCNGPCHTVKPYFGIVRRSYNRAPGPSDSWWTKHQRICGGTFVKISEPENYGKNKKNVVTPKPCGDITKFINITNNNDTVTKPILKDSNVIPVKSNFITKNSGSTIVVTKRNNVIYNPQVVKPPVFSGKGQTISGTSRINSLDVAETVRNVWANKQLSPTLPSKNNTKTQVPRRNSVGTITAKPSKHKGDSLHILSPPSKITKIDDYFKSTATSLLKDLYGKDFEIKETNSNKRLSVVPVNTDLVDCPVCNEKKSSEEINRHLDECLNKEVIKSISDSDDNKAVIDVTLETNKLNNYDNSLDSDKQKSVNVKKENDIVQLADWNANICIKNEIEDKSDNPKIKTEPSTSKSSSVLITINDQKCPCCSIIVSKSINEHLDECLAFFDDNTEAPIEGASTSASHTIVIDDDDDILDETLTLNETGTKFPCPCCLQMIEQDDMNNHLDLCLS
ncbi:DNA-dependent metalloprotease dvc-1 [Maniola jurtina]|uniref:DNA-dependent metalloprotease dvc-1 n=1 Tax=Maniola jurtina TaxID=191418 RepID=UPI001E68C56E|nr:DNA-dependent metalloprotease dvc-1 [Maniola jurtina]XP_045768640.1 DNA-dependent metalloprotease dvc-1 [Maniola jurtina]